MKSFQNVLADQLKRKRDKNSQFSLRAFARSLDMSPAHLSNLINGRKNLSPKFAQKIIDKLDLSENERFELAQDIIINLKSNPVKKLNLKTLKEDEFRLIADWYHLAILSLGRLDNKANAQWLAEKLGISENTAWDAFMRLRRLGLLSVKNGRFWQSSQEFSTTNDIPSEAIRLHHRQNLELAKEKLDTIPVNMRDYSSVTMAISSKKIAKAKRMIHDFKLKLCAELETDASSTDVYTLAIQLFPLTKQGE